MKRLLGLILALSVALTLVVGVVPVSASEMPAELDKIINQEWIEVDDRRLVPLRRFCETLGASVDWDYDTEEATVTLGEYTMVLKDWATEARVNGMVLPIGQPIRILNDTMYGPLRFIAENLGFYVGWDPVTETAGIAGDFGFAKPEPPDNMYEIAAVSASEDDGNKPENVLDNDLTTRWSAESYGAYITLELPEVKPVAYVGIACYQGDVRQTTVSVQVSRDGENYTEVVTKWVSSLTADMEPLSLGGTYDAKYLRILGYGNTANAWNSITELGVFGPTADGSMPMDERTKMPQIPLTAEEQKRLDAFDAKFDRLDKWYANLYDPETGGFYMAMSGKDDPLQQPGLEMTFFALNSITNYSDAIAGTIPESLKQRFVSFIVDRQDPKTGMFVDKQGETNDRDAARVQSATMGWVNKWKIDLPHVHPQQVVSSGGAGETTETVLPEYLESVESYIKWIEGWNWDTNSWTAGDQTMQSLAYLDYMPAEKADVYRQAVKDWLDARQFDNGLWAPEIDFNSISGAFKVVFNYAKVDPVGKQVPNADKIIDSIAVCLGSDEPETAHYVRNPLTTLTTIAGYNQAYATRIRQVVLDNLDKIVDWIDIFACPDGGFSMYHQKSQAKFGGIAGSHQLWEGDVDSTLMLLVARKDVYGLLGLNTPLLDFDDDFWSWMTGENPLPDCYEGNYAEQAAGPQSAGFDFEDFEAGTALTGTEYGDTVPHFTSGTISIEQDGDRKDNRVLAITKNKDAPGAEYLRMTLQKSPVVKYIPVKSEDTVIEFDLKFSETTGSNCFYLGFGDAEAYALNFGGTGAQSVATRVDTSNIQYGGSFATFAPNEWYRVRVEYHRGASKEDFKATVYIDGEKVSVNSNYYGCAGGQNPGDAYGSMRLVWYMKARGTVYLDNITMTKTVQ